MSSSSFPITAAQLWGLFMESVLYGMYLVTCGYCAQYLFLIDGRWKRLREYNWAMVIVAILLLILATLDVTMGFYYNMWAFVSYTSAGATSKAVCCQSITTVEDNTKPVFDAAKKNAVPDATVDFPAGLTCQPTTNFSTCKAKPVCCKTIAKGNMGFSCYRPETGFSTPKA
ncbi:hypothetical protein BDQ12DRAFT_670121 [Crucibulum laeve]|uniref:Hydrophobin n=1 Tax=Crucibulum laeve TaxID=68775 RepID=A0A5C3LXV2_9AGAR|nr:hypothetical protein BDQ12DRAFT_670121 [Crucibulum laeve]